MNGIMGVLEKYLTPISIKMGNNRYLKAISSGLLSTMPVLIIGSIASIIMNLPIESYQSAIKSVGIYALLETLVNVTTNALALYAVVTIAYSFIKEHGYSGVAGALTSLIAFLMLTPLQTMGEGYAMQTLLPFDWVGAKGLFVAMFTALIIGTIFVKIMDRKIIITMPDGVPPSVANSFAGLIPAIISILVFLIIAFIITLTPYSSIHDCIYSLIQSPLQGLGTTLAAAVIIYLLEGLVWFFGIHAIAIAVAVLPIWIAADAENLAAASAGVANADLPNIITSSWTNSVASMGGAGVTFGLVLLMIFKGKSKKNKTLGKLALPASLFSINEPVVFGTPIVLNPILIIPFILMPIICIVIAYVLTIFGLLPRPNGVTLPIGMPVIISGFLIGGWRMALYQLFTIILSVCVYLPFFKILDKQNVADETGGDETPEKEAVGEGALEHEN